MSNQTAYQQYANGAGDAGDHGRGSQVAEKQSNNPERSAAQDAWHRLGKEVDKRGKPKQLSVHQSSPAMKRWEDESFHDQPWHGIGSFSAFHTSKRKHVDREETGSNSAVAGSEERK